MSEFHTKSEFQSESECQAQSEFFLFYSVRCAFSADGSHKPARTQRGRCMAIAKCPFGRD